MLRVILQLPFAGIACSPTTSVAAFAFVCTLSLAGCKFEGAPPDGLNQPDAAPAVDAEPPLACRDDSRYIFESDRRIFLREEVEAEATMVEAMERCAADGAHLAVLDDPGKIRFAMEVSAGDQSWIGLRSTSQTEWRWITRDQPDTYEIGEAPWAGGKPDFGSPNQACARLASQGFDDERCDESRPFLCECPQ